MILFRIVLITLLIQAVAAPQRAAPGSIEGVVLRLGTGQPVAKAVVEIETATVSSAATSGPRPDLSPLDEALRLVLNQLPTANSRRTAVTTGSDGKFAFPNLQPGTYRVSVNARGYVRSSYGQHGPNGIGMPITVEAGRKLSGIQISVTPAGAISGRIIGENGEPISRAQVQALKYAYDETGGRTLTSVQIVLTNDLGEYRLFWLTPGQYYVMATATNPRASVIPVLIPPAGGPNRSETSVIPGTDTQTVTSLAAVIRGFSPGTAATQPNVISRILSDGTVAEEALVPIYFPGSADERKAAPIEVGPGATSSGVNIALAQARVYRIRGFIGGVVAPAGTAPIRLVRQGAAYSGSYAPATFRDGAFEIVGVPPGSYSLSSPTGGTIPIEVTDHDVNGVVMREPVVFTVSGRISIDGASGPGAPLLAQLTSPPPQTRTVNAAISPDGSFIFQNIVAGDYRVRVNDQYYLKAIRFAGVDAQSGVLHIGGSDSGPLELVVGTDAGALEGRVVNERRAPDPNVKVVLVPEAILRGRLTLYKTTVTDAEGRFRLERVAPGAYKLFAWEDVEDRAWLNAEYISMYEDRGRPVFIGRETSENVEVTAIGFQR
jgi:protocatechuate 3,4-dioxygenase beta subunit